MSDIGETLEARHIARGICRTLAALGFGALTEFTLRSGRRGDIVGINAAGDVVIVEIKMSEPDFRADLKWRDYLEFCDSFYFAVPEAFPRHILPEECGLIVADAHEGAILRPAPHLPAMAGARRRALLVSFGLTACGRLQRLVDPHAGL
jgi:hypothetical protein